MAFSRTAIVLALMFVTLPFVVRTVQPVLQELDLEQEEASHSLGASRARTFWRVIFPNILPGILSGRRARVREGGRRVRVARDHHGNIPFETEVSSVHIFGRIESGDSPVRQPSRSCSRISFLTLLSIGAIRHYATRHDR